MKIDVVLQATGNHAHGVSHGIVNSLKKISLLGTVFEPKAFWGNPFPEDDDGLYEYLACPNSEAILFLGFDWHSQSLHTLIKWKTRIKRSSIIKILYSHETLFNGDPDEVSLKQFQFKSAAALCDLIWHSSFLEKNDLELFLRKTDLNKPLFVDNFSVDTGFFVSTVPLRFRHKFAFFRGKTEPFAHPSQYSERRKIISSLDPDDNVEIKSYSPSTFSNLDLAKEYLDYKVCIDLPSVFDGPTTRVYEAIASGCVVMSHERNFEEEEKKTLSPYLRTYKDAADLKKQIKILRLENNFDNITSEYLKILPHISLSNTLKRLAGQIKTYKNKFPLKSQLIRIFDHSYHIKTKSQKFIFDEFSDFSKLFIYGDSTSQKFNKSIYSFLDSHHYPTVYWQQYFHDHAELIDDQNITPSPIVFPMFDASNHKLIDTFPVNATYFVFSKTLHERLVSANRKSFYLRYFPDLSFITSEDIENSLQMTKVREASRDLRVFFWRRTPEIDIVQLAKILKSIGCSKLILKDYPDPSVKQLNDHVLQKARDIMDIELDDWHETWEKSTRALLQYDIYIAPRVCEGIGMSFLEAMSLSLCTIAFDAPTMSEYIEDGFNGILFNSLDDMSSIKRVANSNIYNIRSNQFKRLESEHLSWSNSLNSFRKFMESYSEQFAANNPLAKGKVKAKASEMSFNFSHW